MWLIFQYIPVNQTSTMCNHLLYVTVHAKTFRKSANIFFEIRADFASPIFSLPILQISCG